MGMLVSGKSNMAAGYKMAGKLAQLYVPNVDVSRSFRVYITMKLTKWLILVCSEVVSTLPEDNRGIEPKNRTDRSKKFR